MKRDDQLVIPFFIYGDYDCNAQLPNTQQIIHSPCRKRGARRINKRLIIRNLLTTL